MYEPGCAGVPLFVYLCMAESFVLIVSREGGMQVSSVCWVGVRIGLYSGRNMPKIRPIRPGAGEYQGLGQLATGCRGAD